jgi:pyridoxamine 5'-phosphate oxidase
MEEATMDENQARRYALELMAFSEAAYLATVDGDGRPHIRAMLNLRTRAQYPKLAALFSEHANDLLVYFTTNTSSPKVAQIRANPAVAAYYCEPAKFHGLMLAGDIEIVDDPRVREALWQDGWERFYPGGPNDPDHTVLELRPTVARGWHGEDKVEFDPAT